MRQVFAPFGYKLSKIVDADIPAQVRDLCLDLSDDPEWHQDVNKMTPFERLKFLKDNGFTIKNIKLKGGE